MFQISDDVTLQWALANSLSMVYLECSLLTIALFLLGKCSPYVEMGLLAYGAEHEELTIIDYCVLQWITHGDDYPNLTE